MEKRISFYEFQSVKHVAAAIEPLVKQKDKIDAKIRELVEEYKGYETRINSLQSGIVSVIGLPIDKIIKRVVESGTDKNGNPTKTPKFLPTENVRYDEKTRQYVITINEEGGDAAPAEQAQPAELPANDGGQPAAEPENPFQD